MTSVPQEFINCIRTCQLPALVMLADFAASATSIEHIWYAEEWGNYCLKGIEMALGEENAKLWLTWPKEQAKDRFVSALTCL